ncbi:MAG: permease, partial [Enterococcus lemanii]
MQKKALLKTSIREIKNSPGRFLSILGIIFLGVAFFVGIGATGPDMLRASNNYYKETQLADLTLYSSLGFSKEDQKLTEKADFVESATLQYLFDIYLSDKNQVFRLMNYEPNNPSNQLTLIDGKFPQEKNEILLDNNAAIGQKYKIGDSFDILLKDDPDEQLKEHRFKIVGFVNTSEFIDQTKRGNTNVGNGSIDYFAFLPTEAFNMDAYGRMLIRFRNLNDQAAYTATYDELMVKNETQLKQLLAPRKKERLKEIQEKALKELLANQKKIDDANEQITDGKKQLADAKEQLESGEVELATNQSKFDLEIERAQAEISSQEKQLILAQEELDQQKKMLEEKQRELDVNKGKVEALTEQLTQLNLQKEQLEAVLQQLQESMVLYQEMMQYANQLANLSPEEKVVALEGLKSYLVLLGQTLPTTSELQNLITLLLDGLTVENLDLAIEQLKQLEKLMNEQYIQAQTTISQLEVQMNELANAKETLEAGQAQIDAGRVELETAQAQIKSGQTQLAQGKLDLALEKQKGQQQLTTAKSDLAEGRALYETNLAEFEKLKNEKLPELEKAQKKLNQEREKVMALKA